MADRFGSVVAAVTNWDASTPVTDWVARDVVAHLTDWFPAFLAAGGIELDTAPSAADDPTAAWARRAAQVQELLDGPDPDREFIHPIAGTHPLSGAIDMFYIADIFMHTWDLARAAGVDPGLDQVFAARLLAGMEPIEEMLRASGQYGPAIPVPAQADPVSQLMGFVGRDPADPKGTKGMSQRLPMEPP
ncbi:maleylpyruvate isomerase N-terminal domain-containing protein [Mycobacteroides franklinii]|uniref:maleylpyruvate isomerase N-terminal domain-containing protein n=1 Tax=Mycobacteroides franklinii TaxID=948102 RepID=UPI001E37AF38|nr:maleylpyruvate isomerase N-terminal domain-containing protein [Mycobacteroides franklinii]